MMVVGLRINLRLLEEANSLLDKIEPEIPARDKQGQALASSYRKAIDEGFSAEIFKNQPRYPEIFPPTQEP